MKLGFLCSIIRKEEKLLLDELNNISNVEIIRIDDRNLIFDINEAEISLDVVFDRSVSQSRSLNAIKLFELNGVPCFNSSEVIENCGDKVKTSVLLKKYNLNLGV